MLIILFTPHVVALVLVGSLEQAIGSYDGVIANVIKTQQMRAGLTADDPELSKNQYEIGLIEPQGDLDVDTILMKVSFSTNRWLASSVRGFV